MPQLIEVAHGRAKMKPESQRLALSKQMYTGPQIAGLLVTQATPLMPMTQASEYGGSKAKSLYPSTGVCALLW